MEYTLNKTYCNNCGNYGHAYKDCRHPILSYGIILYNDKSEVIMVERKDTLSYIEFMRGKYKSIYNKDYLKLLFSRFSKLELENINKYEFDDLWKQLWIHTDTINRRIKKEYKNSKSNFNILKKGYTLKNELISISTLIKDIRVPYLFNEWEIPKGRRKMYENNRDCALREFKEETNIPPCDYKLYQNIIPIIEEYEGINGVKYKHVYYIGHTDLNIDLFINKGNKDQYTEIKDIKWYSKDKCLENIRDYDIIKKGVINKFFNYLENHKDFITFE